MSSTCWTMRSEFLSTSRAEATWALSEPIPAFARCGCAIIAARCSRCPSATLGAVQNMSRDWVIDKFRIRVPFDTDVKKVKKLLKGIGPEMLADPLRLRSSRP